MVIKGLNKLICDATDAVVSQYMADVLSGHIATSACVKACVERHLRDLERQSTPDFAYHFDERAASRVCEFFPVALRHSIGEWVGEPFELSPWQSFICWSLFGWKRDSDNTRRYRRAYLSIARKNGKSTFASGLALYMGIGDKEAGAQVVISATKLEQARIVFSEAERMVHKSAPIKERCELRKDNIEIPMFNSFIRPVGSDKPFDGLNPHLVCMDELHAWREHHRPFYDTMVTGSGSRRQPLQLVITTAGDDQSQLWLEEYDYAKKVVLNEVKDETYFVYSAELDEGDDPFEEANWIKANPNLGVSVKLDYLRQQANEAQAKPASRNRFIRYHGNRIVSSTEQAIDLSHWDASVGPLSDWSEADAIGGGFDLGGRDDLCGLAHVARFHIGEEEGKPLYRYEFRASAYIASDSKRDLTQQPLAAWIHAGHLNSERYAVAALRDDLIKDCESFGCGDVAGDPYNAQQLLDELDEEGIRPIKMPQNCSQFNEPIREFLKAMQEGRVRHDGSNPLLRWCAKNAVIRRDSNDRWMFCKKSSKEKIDPLVAIVMAFRVAMVLPARSQGSYFLT